jgi:hypothetical protein
MMSAQDEDCKQTEKGHRCPFEHTHTQQGTPASKVVPCWHVRSQSRRKNVSIERRALFARLFVQTPKRASIGDALLARLSVQRPGRASNAQPPMLARLCV